MINPRKLGTSLGFGFAGIRHVLRHEQNMRIHAGFAVGVIGTGFGFQIERWEWVAVLLCIGFVFATECLNTALERLADRVNPEKDELIGQAKDAAAAAVLLASICAVAVGMVVFLPRVLQLLS